MVTYEAVLDALGDSTRRAILQELQSGPAPVAELARRLPVSRPAVSQHLRVLLEANLVGYDKQGTRNLYRVDPKGLAELRSWLDEFWGSALDRFEQFAHDQHRAGARPRRRGRS